MNTFETSATVEEHGQIRIVGAPFEPGTEVEMTIRAKAAVNANDQTGNVEEMRATLEENDHSRQRKIEELRAQYQEQFDRIEDKTPSLDELLSMTVEPPREWLNER